MKRLSFLVSLITDDNDFQVEQARAAEATAQRLGVDVEIIYAGNDSINQSQQLLNVIQGDTAKHPDAIIFEPVSGTALPHVGRAAAAAEIAWVVLNRQAEYLADLRRTSNAPVFCVSSDHLGSRAHPGPSARRSRSARWRRIIYSGAVRHRRRRAAQNRYAGNHAAQHQAHRHEGPVDPGKRLQRRLFLAALVHFR